MGMERIDDLQLQGLKIIQDTDLFCFGTDAVLLADFAFPKKGVRIVDLGTGTGILPLLLYGRQKEITVDAVEIQDKLCRIAQRSMALNGVEENIHIWKGDIKNAYELLGGGYDMVITNPPYDKVTAAIPRLAESHFIARFESMVTLHDICDAARKLLRSGGKLYMIHRASRLAEIFSELRACMLEPKELRFIHSYATREADRVLICAAKDGKSALRVWPPLVVHCEDGSETEEVKKIYNRTPNKEGKPDGWKVNDRGNTDR
jgi:tRNA1Val (adenine37-N6)-methyltransferase